MGSDAVQRFKEVSRLYDESREKRPIVTLVAEQYRAPGRFLELIPGITTGQEVARARGAAENQLFTEDAEFNRKQRERTLEAQDYAKSRRPIAEATEDIQLQNMKQSGEFARRRMEMSEADAARVAANQQYAESRRPLVERSQELAVQGQEQSLAFNRENQQFTRDERARVASERDIAQYGADLATGFNHAMEGGVYQLVAGAMPEGVTFTHADNEKAKQLSQYSLIAGIMASADGFNRAIETETNLDNEKFARFMFDKLGVTVNYEDETLTTPTGEVIPRNGVNQWVRDNVKDFAREALAVSAQGRRASSVHANGLWHATQAVGDWMGKNVSPGLVKSVVDTASAQTDPEQITIFSALNTGLDIVKDGTISPNERPNLGQQLEVLAQQLGFKFEETPSGLFYVGEEGTLTPFEDWAKDLLSKNQFQYQLEQVVKTVPEKVPPLVGMLLGQRLRDLDGKATPAEVAFVAQELQATAPFPDDQSVNRHAVFAPLGLGPGDVSAAGNEWVDEYSRRIVSGGLDPKDRTGLAETLVYLAKRAPAGLSREDQYEMWNKMSKRFGADKDVAEQYNPFKEKVVATVPRKADKLDKASAFMDRVLREFAYDNRIASSDLSALKSPDMKKKLVAKTLGDLKSAGMPSSEQVALLLVNSALESGIKTGTGADRMRALGSWLNKMRPTLAEAPAPDPVQAWLDAPVPSRRGR